VCVRDFDSLLKSFLLLYVTILRERKDSKRKSFQVFFIFSHSCYYSLLYYTKKRISSLFFSLCLRACLKLYESFSHEKLFLEIGQKLRKLGWTFITGKVSPKVEKRAMSWNYLIGDWLQDRLDSFRVKNWHFCGDTNIWWESTKKHFHFSNSTRIYPIYWN
jgi:hypothetical protein